MKYPVEELQITRASLINPLILSRAIGDFFQKNPSALYWVFIWILLCMTTLVITSTVITNLLSRSITKPISELTEATEKIRSGNLTFEVLGSRYDEIDKLCTDFDNMRLTLKRANEHERQMKTERSMLLANISHDLKTPITSIKGYIDGIRDGVADSPEKVNRYLDTIYSKAITIDDMVNNLSTFSRLELSKLQFNFETVDFITFLKGFLDDYRLDFEKNNMALSTDFPNVEVKVKLDTEKMSRVIANIADNAIKYRNGESGSLSVEIGISAGNVYVNFSDSGIGIDEAEIKSVFDSFYRVDTARSMNIKGSGLGLGIAKQIVEKHGGRIWLRSQGQGHGTTAVISLPIAEM
jgi:signal transduction histidine kinase